jgi:ATP-dependent DNA helicase RecG
MNRLELREVIRNGENSGVEFKRDDVQNSGLAKELVAFLNLDGGMVLLGVSDDGTITGTTRDRLEEWVAELCRVKIEPPVIPYLTWIREVEPERDVLVVRVSLGANKPYALVHNDRRTYFVRVGSTSREASREELERLFQSSGSLHYGLKPVPGADLEALDQRRLRDYFTRVLRGDAPREGDVSAWTRLLKNVELMTTSAALEVATIDGILLFGVSPARFVRQSGIRAVCYPGPRADYATRADEQLRGPLVPLGAADGSLVESGLVEQALHFVRRNTAPTASLEDGRRVDRWDYPETVLREAVVNALVHRDYSIVGTEIMLAIFSDRLEITSPGRLPNTVTVESMTSGMRYARNQVLVNVMRDYGYVDARGMGVRNKIIPGMREHNGTTPDFQAGEHHLTVRLWKGPRAEP